MVNSHWHAVIAILLVVALFLLATINLESTPPLWWDEGWTLTVARTWLEQLHYGILLAGTPAPLGLAAAFPVVAPVALSFRLFGVGIWQGRLPGVLFTLGALALIYYLARRLYNASIANGTLAVLLFMSAYPELHPVLIGRQVLGEMPALFYLLAGYTCLLSALRRSLWFMPLTVIFWGVALITKLQVLPFWTVSLLVPLLTMLAQNKWKSAGLLGTGLLGSLLASRLLVWLEQSLLRGQTIPASPIHGLYDVTALVPVAQVRVVALVVVLMFALPTLFGLCYATWKYIVRKQEMTDSYAGPGVVRLALLVLADTWFAWYVLLSVGWVRYLFPATFVGSMFVAALLYGLTNRFNFPSTLNRAGYALRHLHFNRQGVGALVALILIVTTLSLTLRQLYQSYVTYADTSALQVADFFNTQTPPGTLIETYDSELFFLLDRSYHYPPDQIHVELNRRTFLGQNVPIDYDPLAANPDFLVVGPHSRVWRLYDPVLATGAFRLVRTYGRYTIYERVRSQTGWG